MVRALIDTNVLIDFLSGHEKAHTELDRHVRPAISIITWMEVMVGASEDNEEVLRSWLSSFHLINLDSTVAQRAVMIRQQRRIRLPDAIVWASAQQHSLLLVSRNTKDFPASEPGVRVPYKL